MISVFGWKWANAQGVVPTNYTQFDRKKFHFGFALGFNAADYRFTINPDSLAQDSIVNMVIRRQPGFNLGIISSFNLNQVIHFRFVPSLAFQERLFIYEQMNMGARQTVQNRIEATTLDFPLLIGRGPRWSCYRRGVRRQELYPHILCCC